MREKRLEGRLSLRLSYLGRIPRRIDAVADAVREASIIREHGATARARHLAHALYGTSGSVGLHVVAALARRIEDALNGEAPRYDEAMRRAAQLAAYSHFA